MNSTAPLLRSVTNAVAHTPSKIPHLRFHIIRRQTRSQQSKHNRFSEPVQQRRCQTTLASTEFIDKSVEDLDREDEVFFKSKHVQAAQRDEAWDQKLSSVSDLTNALPATNMFGLLEAGALDRILSGLMSHSIGSPFIQQVNDQIFNKALLSLDPEYFIEPFKAISRHTKGPRDVNHLQTKTLDDHLSAFASYLDRIVALRRQNGRKLDIEAANHLLKCAGSMGDAHLANSVMKTIIPEDGIKPTLESYNYYCQALVWSHAFSRDENYNLRVLPRNLQIRASRRPPASLSGHVTFTGKKGITGIRERILETFKECVDKGYSADELTFSNLMVAMAREADIDGVKSVLKSVWNIDVDMLGTYDEEELQSPTFYEADHPLRPSQRLLYTVAHIFGSNNDVRTAWLLVDFVSRNYDLPVSQEVWLQLCEWAFVLSLRRSKVGRDQGRSTGQIPRQTFLSLVEAMTDEPHNIEADTVVHFLLSRSWRDAKHLDNTTHHVKKMEELTSRQHLVVKNLAKEVMQFTEQARRSHIDAFSSLEFYHLRRRYAIEFAKLKRDLQLMNIAVNQNLLKESNWPGSGRLTDWERRKLPEIVEMFAAYLPKDLTYRTKTGTVELTSVYKRRAKLYEKYKLDYRALPRILNAMDTDDQVRLYRRMRVLPEVIWKAKDYCFNCESVGHTHTNCRNKAFASSTLDYAGEASSKPEQLEDDYILVLDPNILRDSVPFAFEPGSEKEHATPNLPFQ